MKKYLILFVLALASSGLYGCSDDDDKNMVWEVVSNTDPDMIDIVIDTPEDFSHMSNIWVLAGYKSGDVLLRCTTHPIAFSLIGPNDSYINPDMGFTLSKYDANTLRIHFEENASGDSEKSDQITITNADQEPVVCNTFLRITRTFGELQPTE